jgi:hypothetical protein
MSQLDQPGAEANVTNPNARDAASRRRGLLVAGELVEYWENPDVSFRCSREGLQAYIDQGEWELVFNALALLANPPADCSC